MGCGMTQNEQQYRERIGELEEQVCQLHDIINDPDLHFPAAWKLTPGETRALRCLFSSKSGIRSTEILRIAISKGEETGVTLVNSIICRLRQKLKDEKIVIVTRKGEGYELTAESRAILMTKVLVPQVLA